LTIYFDTLANGIKVLTEEIPTIESVSVGVWIGVGSRNENKRESGIAHFLEHMAFKGTEKRSALQIAESIENVGGFINAYTSKEITCYYAKILKDDLPLAVDILSDIISNSVYKKEEIEREKGVIIQEIGQIRDTPDEFIFELLQKEAFSDTELGRSILGTVDNVSSFKRDDFIQFTKKNYFSNRIVVCGAGNLKHQELCTLAEKFQPVEGGDHKLEPQKIPFLGGEKRVEKDLEQAHFAIGFEAPSIRSPRLYAGKVFSVLMGGGMSSRLFQEIREKRGLCYSIGTSFDGYSDIGMLLCYSGTAGEKIKELSEVIALEFNRSVTDITEVEVERAKTQLRASLLMSLESSSSRSERLARGMIIWERIVEVHETISKIDDVTLQDVKDFGSVIFNDPKPAMVLYGQVSAAPKLNEFCSRLQN